MCDQSGRALDFSAGYKLFNNRGVVAAVHPDLLDRIVRAVGEIVREAEAAADA